MLGGLKKKGSRSVFWRDMEAELVAVAGQYRVFENKVPPEMIGRPVQVFLEGDKIVIASLD